MARPTGSRNKRSQAVADAVADAVPGFNPVVLLCQFAADENQPAEFRADCAKAAAPYLTPRLKASEIRHEIEGLAERIQRAKARVDDLHAAGKPAYVLEQDGDAIAVEVNTGISRSPTMPLTEEIAERDPEAAPEPAMDPAPDSKNARQKIQSAP